MYTLFDYLKYSWLARVVVLLVICTHWLPIALLPYAAISVLTLIFWLIHAYQRQTPLPNSLMPLFENIVKDRNSQITICLRLTNDAVFEFDTKNYIFTDEKWDIYYYGHANQRYLEFGPKALSQRSINIHIFESIMRFIPRPRLQRVMLATSVDILNKDMSIHFLKPYFQHLSNRFKNIPYDILVNNFWQISSGRHFYAYDFHSKIHSSQYCQLLKQHIEDSIFQLFHTNTDRLAEKIVGFDQLIHPLQNMIQSIQNNKRFTLQCALVFNKPIEWQKHLPQTKRIDQKRVLWLYGAMCTLIALTIWQARDLNALNHLLKSQLITKPEIATSQTPQTQKQTLSTQALLTQATSYARSHHLVTDNTIPKLQYEHTWDSQLDLPPEELITQLRSVSPEELTEAINRISPKPGSIESHASFIHFEQIEQTFKQRALLKCIHSNWTKAPLPIEQACINAQQQTSEIAWVNENLDLIQSSLIPAYAAESNSAKLTQNDLETVLQNPSEFGKDLKDQIPLLIHFAAKHQQSEQLQQLSDISHFLSNIDQSLTWYMIKKYLAMLSNQKFTSTPPKSLNKLDSDYSAFLENDIKYKQSVKQWQLTNTAWQKDVLPTYTQLKTCFPFKLDAKHDCTQATIKKFFDQNGVLESFIQHHLKDQIGINSDGYYWKETPSKATPYILEHLMLAKVIQQQLLNSQGEVELTAIIKPSLVPPNAKIRINSGKHVYDISDTQKPEIKIRWQPYNGETFSITTDAKSPEVYPSPWGLYKWVMTHIHDEQTEAYNLSVMSGKQQFLLKLYKTPGVNLWDPHLLSSFELPTQITDMDNTL